MVARAAHGSVGVDLEDYAPARNGIADRILVPEEIAVIGTLPEDRRWIALVLRFVWRIANVKPDDSDLSPFERRASRIAHWGFYPLLLALMVSGYLISTADGRPIDVFGWFPVPSPGANKGLEDTAGAAHTYLAYLTIALAAVHTAGALKHHLVDRKDTLKRMWSGPPSN